MKFTAWCLTCLAIPFALVVGDAHGFPVCIEVPPAGFGSVTIDLALEADLHGSFVHVIGSATVRQTVSPPNGEIVYSVSGTAIPNADGFWISLTGAGYNTAKEVVAGLFAIQLSDDAAKQALTYFKQDLEGSPPTLVTRTPQLKTCETAGL